MWNIGVLLSSLIVSLLCVSSSMAIPKSNLTDQASLLALKTHLQFDPLVAKNWSTATSFCNWIGITCSTNHHRVTALDLPNMQLRGSISPHVGNLSFLESINLNTNSLQGGIPLELAHLRRLKYLDLGNNNLGGEIPPGLGTLPSLQLLNLANDSLSGTIPATLFNMSKLEELVLQGNSLEGSIPGEIGDLSSLEILDLAFNLLSGSFPPAILNLPSLVKFSASNNNLTGSLEEISCSNHHQDSSKLELLNLEHNQLHGEFPFALHQCKELRALGLDDNKLSGVLPEEIGSFSKLEGLYLSNNNFTGEVPEQIGDLVNLVILDLTNNDLRGGLPRSIGNCSSLQSFDIARNKLTGSIPTEIGNCTNLEELTLRDNKFTGTIPSEIGNLQYLQILDLGGNGFTGPVPSIFNLSMARALDLNANYLSGHLPMDLGLWLPNVQLLYLAANLFSGPIPESITNASQLSSLDLSYNSLSGFIPDSLASLRYLQRLNLMANSLTSRYSSPASNFISSMFNSQSLEILWLDGNPLNCSLPTSIGNWSSSLTDFSAYNCSINGEIPRGIGNLSNLLEMELRHNELVGTIPSSMGNPSNIQALFLAENQLNGSIPFELCHLKSLSYLNLGENKLSGQIPDCLGDITSLRELDLDDNLLTSEIPSSLWKLKDILELNLSSNLLVGSLPLELGNLKVVTLLDLSHNQLSEEIPISIGGLQNVANLSLARNMFTGNIPPSIGDLASLELLDLSSNDLTGTIPKSLEKLIYLKQFNVSYNKLEGQVPDGGPFANFSAQSFQGNRELCGSARVHLQRCRNPSSKPAAKQSRLKYILPVIACSALLLGLTIFFTRNRNKKKPVKEELPPLATWQRTSYYDLERATGRFHETNLLGAGSFGSVYKGTFPDGTIVAVKVFNSQREGAFTSFETECEALRNIRHRNLVKIISSCSNLDFKALVLQFMPSGSLDKWLYSHNYFLNIFQRLDVMIDVASALEYLHLGYTTPVVHCDLKPSNVLLDENMVAHLGDFGLAKLLGEGDSMTQTMTLATIGYMPPEFGSEGIVSVRGDVYSYGILLMETFTRKRPTDELFGGEMSLKLWVEQSLPGALKQVADANLLNKEEKHLDAMEDCVTSVLDLGLTCSADLPQERMNMRDVLATLHKIRTKLLQDTKRR